MVFVPEWQQQTVAVYLQTVVLPAAKNLLYQTKNAWGVEPLSIQEIESKDALIFTFFVYRRDVKMFFTIFDLNKNICNEQKQ